MGNSSSSPNAPQIPPNPMMNSIYNTTGSHMPHIATHRSYVPPSNTSETSKLKLDSFIDKNTLTLTQISNLKFSLSFNFTSQVPCTLGLYFFAIECPNQSNLTTMVSDTNFRVSNYIADCSACTNQQFLYQLNLEHLSIQQIFNANIIPITIEIFPYYFNSGQGAMLRTLCKLERRGARIAIVIKKQTAFYGGNAFVLMDIFGISNGGEENRCVICLTEAKDTMMLPCRHVCLCKYCSVQLGVGPNKNCPICRMAIKEFITLKMD